MKSFRNFSFADMWVETIPTVGVWLGTFYLGYMGKMYTDEAGT